jgi:hypothetical protein
MKNKKILVSEILRAFNEKQKIKGHFSKKVYDLGDMKFGLDIFAFCLKKTENDYVVKMTGLYRYGVVKLLEHLGICYKKEYGAFILIRNQSNIIREISQKEIKDLINKYLHQLPPLTVDLGLAQDTYTQEAQIELFYRQTNLVLNEKFLEVLFENETPVIKDTSDSVNLFFNNGILEITKNEISLINYENYQSGLVWHNNIIKFELKKRDFNNCHFSSFIRNVCNDDSDRVMALRTAIGYLLHSFHRKSGGQMVLFYDQSITDLNNPQGGTGKGLLANALSILRKTVKIDGKKFRGDNRFDFQDVTVSTRIVWLDDVGKQMDIDRFNSVSTDGFNVEKKFKDSIFIPPEASPKILICSNIILDCSGTTRTRRQFIIEFSDHYSSKIGTGVEEPIVAEHGCRFFTDDWDKSEWNRYYWYIIYCIQLYLEKGLVPVPSINLIENRLRQTMGEELFNWVKNKKFSPNEEYNTKELFEEYRGLYEDGNSKFTQRTFSNNLKKYFTLSDFTLEFFTKSLNGQKTSLFRISN